MALARRMLFGTAVGTLALLAGCSTDTISADTVIIDVRTPAEFAAGHLEGATNIDIEAADFATKIGKLDKAKSYFVYCRSGNRSAQAITKMKAAGFTHLVDGGGIDAAARTAGKSIVK